jgi:tripartite-type tricarboxylate transporter receptor subunit TctC
MKTTIHPSRRNFVKASLAGAIAAAVPLGAGAQAANFRGKTIDFVIPFPVAGGSDVWARFYAPYMQKYLPGNPTVVVKNVPGGGSIRGANEFAARARPDGLTILGTSGSTQFPYLLGDTRVRYEYKDWKVVLASPTGGVVYVSGDLGVKSAADIAALRKAKLIYGSEGATSLSLVPMLAFRQLDLPVHYVFGMKSRGGARLAFERGESNIDYQTSAAYLASVMPLVNAGRAVPLFSFGVLDEAASSRATRPSPTCRTWGRWWSARAAGRAGWSGTRWSRSSRRASPRKSSWCCRRARRRTSSTLTARLSEECRRTRSSSPTRTRSSAISAGTGKAAETLYRVATEVSPASRYWVREHLSQNYGVKFE